MATLDDNDLRLRREQVMQECQNRINNYKKMKEETKLYYVSSTIIGIVLGGITPVLVLIPEIPRPTPALSAALATISIQLAVRFQWRENWNRFVDAEGQLMNELFQFQAGTGEQYRSITDSNQALDHFTVRIISICSSEVDIWLKEELQRRGVTVEGSVAPPAGRIGT